MTFPRIISIFFGWHYSRKFLPSMFQISRHNYGHLTMCQRDIFSFMYVHTEHLTRTENTGGEVCE